MHRPLVFDRVTYDYAIRGWRLRTPSELQGLTRPAKKQAQAEITTLQLGSAWEANRIGRNLSLMHLPVHGAQQLPTLPRITIANIPIEEVTIWRKDNDNSHTLADLQGRKVGTF